MKIILTLSLLGQMALANFNSFSNQKSYVVNHAKETRHQLHRLGHSQVGSTEPVVLSFNDLKNHYQERSMHEKPLTREEYSQLFACVKSPRCNLWGYEDYSSNYGGTASSYNFILFYANSSKPVVISHTTYSE